MRRKILIDLPKKRYPGDRDGKKKEKKKDRKKDKED